MCRHGAINCKSSDGSLFGQAQLKFALLLVEFLTQAIDHARQLMEKRLGKPFFDGAYAKSTPRLTPEDWEEGLAWINDRFFPIRYEDEALPSVDWVLNVAKAAVLR